MTWNPFPESITDRMRRSGVIAVLVIDDAAQAVQLARALVSGGIDMMELTLRTPAALDCLRAISAEVPEMMAGAGTLLFPQQVADAVAAGAVFGVAPGTNPQVIRQAADCGLPFAPGVVTPTDVDLAIQCGCRILKFFPAEQSGGLQMLSAIKAPYAHLGLKFIPLGGITTSNLSSYLSDPDVIAAGGSWLAPRHQIAAGSWDLMTAAAREAQTIVRRHRAATIPTELRP